MGWIVFEPVYQRRVWGGDHLAQIFHRELPDGPIGESWEIVDREDAQSRTFYRDRMMTLRDMIRSDTAYLMGPTWDPERRFPVLVKLLDCADVLSVQVHPSSHIASCNGGESKDELWYVMHVTREDAQIYVGLKDGTTQQNFVQALFDGCLEDRLHSVESAQGHSIFVPSGRVHALGAGNIILEIQENSDTTYRVYDWNRMGLDGMPRQLHVEQALQCINFDDHEPVMMYTEHDKILAKSDVFSVSMLTLDHDLNPLVLGKECMPRILHVVSGFVHDHDTGTILHNGQSAFVPYGESLVLHTFDQARILLTSIST